MRQDRSCLHTGGAEMVKPVSLLLQNFSVVGADSWIVKMCFTHDCKMSS